MNRPSPFSKKRAKLPWLRSLETRTVRRKHASKLRRDLPKFFIRTAQEEGWSTFKNGDLLRHATTKFDVFVTIDQRMRYQQRMTQFQIGVVVIEVPDTRFVHLRALVPQLNEAIANVAAGEVVIVKPTP